MVLVRLARTVLALNTFLLDLVISGSFKVLLDSSQAELGIVTFPCESGVGGEAYLCDKKRLNGDLRRSLNSFDFSNIA